MSSQLKTVIDIAQQAGDILSSYFGTNLKVDFKQGKFDPVTRADQEADAFIRTALKKAFPGDQILSEEDDYRPDTYDGRVWMVDPLDGTKDFVGNRPSFAVMIGLLQDKKPQLGVVYSPISQELFYAERGAGAFSVISGLKMRLQTAKATSLANATLVTRNQVRGDDRPLDTRVNNLGVKDRFPEGSIGLKLSRIASGQADVFVHTNLLACKWDTLAPSVILGEAGGVICDLTGQPLDHTKPSIHWDKYFAAAANQQLLDKLMGAVGGQPNES